MDLLIVFDADKKLRNGHAKLWMYDLRSDLAQRDEDKLSIRHLGMGDAQILLLYDDSVI
jgi:hypothetical protein